MGFLQRAPDKSDYYGMLAFAGTGLGAFFTYAFAQRIQGEPWQLVVTFVLGAIYILLGTFSYQVDDGKPCSKAIFYWVQLTLVLTVIYVSPVRGFFAIIALPLASQTVFMFNWKAALMSGFGLYLTSCGVFWFYYGAQNFREALVSFSPAYLFTLVFSFVTKSALIARENAVQLTQQLEAANHQLRAQAAQTAELATTRERNRVAREIHDGVGHYLTVINVQLEAARAVVTKDPARAAAALDKATRLSREALDDVRRSVGTLRAEEQRPPLADAIRALALDTPGTLAIDLTITGIPRDLSSAAEHALFRAAQEGLTNVRKHARAHQARLHLDFSDAARIRLQILDDGPDHAIAPNGSTAEGFGLRGMRERIGLLGGQVDAGPRPEGGFALTVEVPA